jgi:hypothetical protein
VDDEVGMADDEEAAASDGVVKMVGRVIGMNGWCRAVAVLFLLRRRVSLCLRRASARLILLLLLLLPLLPLLPLPLLKLSVLALRAAAQELGKALSLVIVGVVSDGGGADLLGVEVTVVGVVGAGADADVAAAVVVVGAGVEGGGSGTGGVIDVEMGMGVGDNAEVGAGGGTVGRLWCWLPCLSCEERYAFLGRKVDDAEMCRDYACKSQQGFEEQRRRRGKRGRRGARGLSCEMVLGSRWAPNVDCGCDVSWDWCPPEGKRRQRK